MNIYTSPKSLSCCQVGHCLTTQCKQNNFRSKGHYFNPRSPELSYESTDLCSNKLLLGSPKFSAGSTREEKQKSPATVAIFSPRELRMQKTRKFAATSEVKSKFSPREKRKAAKCFILISLYNLLKFDLVN